MNVFLGEIKTNSAHNIQILTTTMPRPSGCKLGVKDQTCGIINKNL